MEQQQAAAAVRPLGRTNDDPAAEDNNNTPGDADPQGHKAPPTLRDAVRVRVALVTVDCGGGDADAEGFGIKPGTLEIVETSRRQWSRPATHPLVSSGEPSPVVEELARSWRVLRLQPAHPMDGLVKKRELSAETTLLKNYEPRAATGEPTFPCDVCVPWYLQPRVAVEDAAPFLVSPRVRFALGMIEPLYCRLVLYDVQLGCRASEEFSFSLPLGTAKQRVPPRAVFYALPNHQAHHLYLVLKVSKGLVGDADIATAPYCTPEKFASEADQQRLAERATDSNRRLGRYSQPLAWGAISLADGPNRSVTLYRQRMTLSDEQRLPMIVDAARSGLKERVVPAMCEIDIERIDDQRLDESKFLTKSLKTLTKETFKLSSCPILELQDPFTPREPTDENEQQQAIDGEDESNDVEQTFCTCCEVQPLCHPSARSVLGLFGSGPLAMSYVHAMYVYALHVDRFQFRNIAIRVQLLQREVEFVCGMDEFDTQNAVVPSFYGSDREIVSSSFVQVNYHQKNPQFEKEIKLSLPDQLTPAHHLLFTFFHVHCKKLQPGQQQQELVGCCALPILNHRGALLEDGEFVLNVTPPSTASKNSTSGGIISLPAGYVDAARSLPTPDSSKTTFTLRAHAMSSLRSQDSSIAALLEPFQSQPIQELDAPTNDQVIERLIQVRQTPSDMLRHFFLPATRFILAYMRFADDSHLRQVAFRSLLSAFEKAKWNDQRSVQSQDPNETLLQFAALVFDDDVVERCASRVMTVNCTKASTPGKRPKSTLQAIVVEWLQLLRSKSDSDDTVQAKLLSLRCANIFLQLILKAMAMQSPRSASVLPLRTSREDDMFVEDLVVKLVEETTNSANGLIIQKHVNESVAVFCRGLFLVTKSALPLRIIHFALGWMQRFQADVAVTVHVLFRFLKTLIEFEFFAVINAFHTPSAPTEHRGQRRGAWLARLIFERLLEVADQQVEDRIRSEALGLLRRMFVLQVYNPRHQHHDQQELIALMYFPMIPTIARFTTDGKLLATSAANADALDSPEGERTSVFRKELLICVAHLLSSVTLPYLSWYFRQSALVVDADTIERNNGEQSLSPTASLLHYRRLIEETKLRIADARRQSLIQRSLDKAFAVASPAARASVYDEIRVHACLSLVRQVIEVFLVDDMSQSSSSSLQVLSPDLAPSDRRVSLFDLEVQRKHRQSRLRGGSLGQDAAQNPRSSIAAGSKSPNAKHGPTAGSFSAGPAGGTPRLTAQKSLPRNWGKNYVNAQGRSSMVSSGDVSKSGSNSSSIPSASSSGSKRVPDDAEGEVMGDEYEANTRNLHRIIADTTLKAIRTAIDQFEWVIRIIESPLDYRTNHRRNNHGKITIEHAFTLLGSIVDIFFLLMKRASSIECLCTAATSEIDEEVDEEADCFLADLFRQLQAFLVRFQRALFATRIAGLPLIHDQSRIFLLVSLSATAKLASVRQLAASLLCRLIHVCYEQTGSFLLIKRPLLKVFCANFFSTSALQIPTDALRDTIDLWRQQSLFDQDGETNTAHAFELLLAEMLNNLTSQIKVFETWHRAMVESDAAVDGEELEEGLYRVVQSVSTFWLLDVKTQWMDALIQLHAARKRYAEATCCALENIAFKEEAARTTDPGQPSKPADSSNAWIVIELRSARELAQKANWIEKVVEIDERLLLTLRQIGRFVEYRDTLRHLDTTIQQLAEHTSEQATTQVFAFYRVVLAGDCVPLSVAAHEYVYKRSRFVSLGEFVGEMKAMLRGRFPTCERVDIIPESKPIPSLERNPNVVFMRVTNLELLLLENQPQAPLAGASFRFSTPFTAGNGASYGKTAEQMKRVIYLSTARCFPSVTSRQVVSSRREQVRCPIDNSMDDIRKRCGLLQDEISKESSGRTDLKTLTLVLKGSVDTHVHGGIPEVIDAFLAASAERGGQLPLLMDVDGTSMDDAKATDRREELADLLVEFLELCWVCLLVSRQAFRRASNQPPQQQSSSFFGSDSNGSSSALSSSAQTASRQRSRSSGAAGGTSSIARVLASLSLTVVVDDDVSPSPLQVEFERSFAILVEQMRTKVAFSYSRDGDLEALYEHVQRHTRTRAPSSKPSLSSMVLASAAPPPPSQSASAPTSTAAMLLPPPTPPPHTAT